MCREQLSLKQIIFKNHIQSAKHKKGKEKLESKGERQRTLFEGLRKYNEENNPRGETLPEEQQVYHIQVVTAFIKARVPLQKSQIF